MEVEVWKHFRSSRLAFSDLCLFLLLNAGAHWSCDPGIFRMEVALKWPD